MPYGVRRFICHVWYFPRKERETMCNRFCRAATFPESKATIRFIVISCWKAASKRRIFFL